MRRSRYISTARDSVSSAFQTTRISSKIRRCASSVFNSSQCLNMAMKHYLLPLISYMNHVSWLWLCQNYGSFKNHGSRKMIAEFHWPSSLVLFSCYVHLTFSIFFFTKLSVLTSLFSNKCLSSPLLVSESQQNIYIY